MSLQLEFKSWDLRIPDIFMKCNGHNEETGRSRWNFVFGEDSSHQ